MWAASTSGTPATRRRSSPRRTKTPSCTSPPGIPQTGKRSDRRARRFPHPERQGSPGKKKWSSTRAPMCISAAASAEEGRAEIRGHPARLPPPGGRPGGLAKGSIDAWAIWDPYFASAERDLGARILTDARGYTTNREFILASRTCVEEHEDIIRAFLEELKQTTDRFNEHPKKPPGSSPNRSEWDVKTVEKAITRSKYGLVPMNESIVKGSSRLRTPFSRRA